jgi:redox-sensitive bicupin YhaK (pirin superfamily)
MKNSINLVIEPRAKDIGITVRRILPWQKKRMVGPFIFLDHMGPAHLHPPEDHMDVRPHPHIGLSTLTYLFEGAIVHRDSLGVVQTIVPGEVNWMTAGKGISHSERESTEQRTHDRTIHGLQFWVALPKDKEDVDPSFDHYGISDIPKMDNGTAEVDIVAGSAFGKTSPLKAYSPMKFMIIKTRKNGSIDISSDGHELAVYVVKGSIKLNGEEYSETKMVVFNTGSDLSLEYPGDAVIAVLGGEPFPESRYIWWNLVSSDHAKIEAAKVAWTNGTFPMVPGETEKIPLPDDRPSVGQIL